MARNKKAAIDSVYDSDANAAMSDPTGSQKTFEKDFETANEGARAARASQNNLYNQLNTIVELPDSEGLKVGSGMAWRRTVFSYLQTALGSDTLAKLGAVHPDDLSNVEIANKLSTAAANVLGERTAGFWKQALQATQPGADVTKRTSNELMANALSTQKQSKDDFAVMQEYANRPTIGRYGVNGLTVIQNANPTQLYQRDREILFKLLNDKTLPADNPKNPYKKNINPVSLVLTGQWDPTKFDQWVDDTYGPMYKTKHFHLSSYLQ